MYKHLTIIAIIFIALFILVNNNDDAELVKAHEIKVVKFNYEQDFNGSRRVAVAPYVVIESYHGKKYKIYTKKNVSIPVNKLLTIYEYKRNYSDMHYFTLHKK